MPYSTQIDIERAIGADKVVHLADDNGDGAADAGVVAEAIGWADGEIDSYAAGKYALPFQKNGVAAIPAKIVDRSAELAGAWLYRRKQVVDAPQSSTKDTVFTDDKLNRF